MSFYIGQKVVCINDNWGEPGYDEHRPTIGQILTIRDIVEHRQWPAAGLRFCEITNAPHYYFDIGDTIECVMDARRFRPAVERKTDITVFQKMLTDERVTV